MPSINKIDTVNFKGSFLRNAHLEKAMEKASDYELYKFSKLLNRMKNTNDERYFELFEYMSSENNSIISFYKYKPLSSKMYKIGFGPKENKKGEKTCYHNVIREVCHYLEKIYPEPQTTNIPREASIRRILDIVE